FAGYCPVLYVNSLGVRVPSVGEGRMFLRRVLRKFRSLVLYCCDGGEGFAVFSPVFLPVFKGPLSRCFGRGLEVQIRTMLRLLGMHSPLLWVACPSAAVLVGRLPRAAVVYQLSDCYTALPCGAEPTIAAMEETLGHQADLVVCSSITLHRRARRLFGCGEYVDHGVDFELFESAVRRPRLPRELVGIRHPIVGFFGNMDTNTVDCSLLEQVIRLRPRYRFVLVGAMTTDFGRLRRYQNVIAVGQKPYRAVAHYGAAFDVCLMPWRRNEWIDHCNPVKVKEYLALGKPVVSTSFPELRQYGGLCYEACSPGNFASLIDQALREDNPARRAKRQAWAAQHSWESKFARVLELLEARGIQADGRANRGG
ncbi:MAG: glycosyltransferase, partial [Phycisphaerae bacterium]